MASRDTPQITFRSDINGLRAIAVAAVVLFHFAVPGIGGGFAGVDVFFVISGYLMTQIIFPQVENMRFSLIYFYLARARRILPALVALCIAVTIAGWFTLLPADYKTLGKHVAGALSFVSNIVFARESGYFDAAPVDKWLLHTWSLSVEWQFYIIYPIVAMLAIPRLGRRMTGYLVVAACISSLVLAGYATGKWPTQAFYLLPTRAWEMLAGAIVFLYPIDLAEKKMKLIEITGLFFIVFAFIFFSHPNAWPGYSATIPVIGAMAVLWARRGDSIFTSNKFSTFIGKISYSVYLWHWPIVVAINYYDVAKNTLWCVSGIVGSTICGWISYNLIETKKTKTIKSKKSSRLAEIRMLVLPVALIGIACAIHGLDGFPGPVRSINSSERAQFIAAYHTLHETGLGAAYRQECDFYDWNTKHAKSVIDASCTQFGGKGVTFLWGDSYAQALSLGLKELVGANHLSQVATSGCPPSLDGKSKAPIENNCVESSRFALSEISRIRPDTVILAQREEHIKTDWNELARILHEAGVQHVVLVGPAPFWNPPLPALVARKHWLDRSEFIDDGIHIVTLSDNLAMAKKARESKQFDYVSMTDLLCPDGRGCRAFLPGRRTLIAVDYGHLSPSGSIYVVDHLLRAKIAH